MNREGNHANTGERNQVQTASRSQLVTAHDRLACKRAHVLHRRLPDRSIELEDLIQIAREGLVEAAHAWSESDESGASFATFAYYRINGALVDHVRSVIGRDGQRLGVVNARSLDQSLPGASGRTLLDHYDDQGAERELDDVETMQCLQVAGLDERERALAVGMLNEVPLKALAKQLGISQSRVSQLVARMQEKMEAQGMAPASRLVAA
jgi:RNA polymerase sigma factor (sigma-70 family)